MNIRPIFPYNSQVFKNLLVRSASEDLVPSIPKPLKALAQVLPNLKLESSLGINSHSSMTTQQPQVFRTSSINNSQVLTSLDDNVIDASKSDWVAKIESVLTSVLTEVVQTFTEALTSVFERSLKEILNAVQTQPSALSTTSAQQSPIDPTRFDAPVSDIDLDAQPEKKKKKKAGFFSKLGKGLANFAKKGLSKLGDTALKTLSRFFL